MATELPGGLTVESLREKSKLFEFLDDAGRQRMLAIARRVAFDDGQVVVKEGDAGDSFFVIASGLVRVVVDDFGTPKQVALLGPGNFFGEIAVVTNQPRSASVVAQGALELVRFDKEPVLGILKDYPRVREIMAKMGMRRTEDTMDKMMGMHDEPTPDPDAGGGEPGGGASS